MLNYLKIIWLFYQKLVIPVLVISLLIFGWLQNTKSLVLTFALFLPLFQYFIYELRNKEEYYFYYNLGFSRKFWWISTLVLSLLLVFIVA